MGKSHRVFVAVDNCQAEHQATVIEATSIMQGSMVIILFDSRATNYFISPYIVDHCRLVAVRHDVNWEVELTSRARVSISSMVHNCQI